ncbi:hypothetical protein [Texcoconibacillus texcoconensis]|uniref:YVTN family beta-propeller protein n=1 Tax=Texcoconibacillus texcoconensis TaxID=1095777 RepID=A0A840QGV6_9BACI|nr:hypothetical protein [Texcoconibacillus texcoconensis]MBB5171882.1 YVTN family beta-propeller protein [Texcoconibacillus texcoconensis]
MLKAKMTIATLIMFTFLSACALEESTSDGANGDEDEGTDAGELTDIQFYVPSEEGDLISVIDVVSGEHVADIETGQSPTLVTFSSTMRDAFVANQDSSTIEILDTQALEVETEVEVGPRPHGLALSSNNEMLYVATAGDQYLDVVDVNEQEVSAQYDLGNGARTNYVHLEGEEVYVSDHENDQLYVLNAETGELQSSYDTGGTPRVVRKYDDKLYVASSEEGTLEVIDLENDEKEVIDVGRGATDVVVNEDGNQAIVTSVEESFVGLVDLTTGEVTERIEDQEGAKHLSFNREESRVYVTLSDSNEVSVIDVDSFQEEYRIEVGGEQPHGIEMKALPGIGGSC